MSINLQNHPRCSVSKKYPPKKLTCPLKNDGWKITCSFEMVPSVGTCWFSDIFGEEKRITHHPTLLGSFITQQPLSHWLGIQDDAIESVHYVDPRNTSGKGGHLGNFEVIPSWELTYPFPRHLFKMSLLFTFGGICDRFLQSVFKCCHCSNFWISWAWYIFRKYKNCRWSLWLTYTCTAYTFI